VSIKISDQRKVGTTNLSLPVLGLGSAPLGEIFAKIDEEDARGTLNAAWDNGVRFYDTAPWYGRGLAEHRMGGFLRTKPRDEFKITTKVGRTLFRPKEPKKLDRSPWKGGLNFEVNFDYSYDGIMNSYEQALVRLALDTVDALVIHDLDSMYHPDPDIFAKHQKDLRDTGMKALEELKSRGDIQAYGMGVNTADALVDVVSQVDLDFTIVAMPYTLIDQSSLHTGMAKLIERNISVIIGSPFASGILVTGAVEGCTYNYELATEEIIKKVRGIEAVCDAHKVRLGAAAMQFVLAHPAVAAIIPGAVKASEVTQNVASLQTPIPADFWADLKAKGLIVEDAPTPE